MPLRWLTACSLVIPMLGCEGRTTTDTLPWSCNEPSTQCPVAPEPAGLAAFWRFDEGDLGGEWHGDGYPPNWAECEQAGGDWGRPGGAAACGTERLGGYGGSLRLAGTGHVAAPLPAQLADRATTLAAWVSLYRETSDGRMSVLSIVRPSCQSVWLDVQTQGTRRTLVLSAESPGPSDAECVVREMTGNLPSGFLDWGLGNWYHVGALVNGDQLALLVDGTLVEGSSADGLPRPAETNSAVHIGAGPIGESRFMGLIDDVALFDSAVDPGDLQVFATESTSVLTDGQHWTAWSADGSSAAWKSDCKNPTVERTDQGASIVVDNGYWSAGGLRTRTGAGRRIGSLKQVVLVADIPENESFDFVLGSRHNAERCTWNASGRGKSRYEFSLADVHNCDCPSTCDCAFRVEEARVSSRWDTSVDVKFSVCRVEFEWGEEEDPIVELGPGGMYGLNGWCWRPISYHENSSVDLDESLTDATQTVATQSGANNATAYLAADFALGEPGEERRYCDLTGVEQITLEADMPEGYTYQFRLADFYGVGLEWSGKWAPGQLKQDFRLCPEDEGGDECGEDKDPIRHLHRSILRTHVRHLGVQKNFETATDPTTISIKSVTFSGEPKDNCVISSSTGGGGPG